MYFLIYSSLYIPPAPSERLTQPTIYYVFFVSLTKLSSVSLFTLKGRMIAWKGSRRKYLWPNLNSCGGICPEISRLTAKSLNQNFRFPDRANYVCCYLLPVTRHARPSFPMYSPLSPLRSKYISYVIKEIGMCFGLYHCRLYVRYEGLWLNEERFFPNCDITGLHTERIIKATEWFVMLMFIFIL
jgi:hypothetical protein